MTGCGVVAGRNGRQPDKKRGRNPALSLLPSQPDQACSAAAFSKLNTPFCESTRMVSLGPKRPDRISFASGFSSSLWIARLSGRAPYTGQAGLGDFGQRGFVISSFISICTRRFSRPCSWMRAMLAMCFSSRAWNTTTSSIAVDELGAEVGLHFANTAELDDLIVIAAHALDHLRAEVGCHHDHGVAEVDGAALAVVRRPSSSTCSSTLKTSGCAFSTSSIRMTE